MDPRLHHVLLLYFTSYIILIIILIIIIVIIIIILIIIIIIIILIILNFSYTEFSNTLKRTLHTNMFVKALTKTDTINTYDYASL